MKLSAFTKELLEDIERRIDPETEEDFLAQWRNFWEDGCDQVSFIPRRKKVSQPGTEYRNITVHDLLHDLETMLQWELQNLSGTLAGYHRTPNIRADFGAGIIPSMFGAEIFEMPPDIEEWPITRPLPNGSDGMRELLDKGVPDIRAGFGEKIFAYGEMCMEIFQKYPKIQKYVHIYHPDGQGPLALADMLWGGDMYYEMFDDPDLVHNVMKLMTQTYKKVLDHWFTIVPKKDLEAHWGWMFKGHIFLRNDSAVNLSPELFTEYALPYDKELLDYYDGGCIHFCGRGDHWIPIALKLDSVRGFQLSQPHLNDMRILLNAASENKKKIIGLPPVVARAYEKNPKAARGFIEVEMSGGETDAGIGSTLTVDDYNFCD